MKPTRLFDDERQALRAAPVALADRLYTAGERLEALARQAPRGPGRAALLEEAVRLIGLAADLLTAENARLRPLPDRPPPQPTRADPPRGAAAGRGGNPQG